jgi:hypothetical protein
VRSTLRAVPATAPDPFLNHAATWELIVLEMLPAFGLLFLTLAVIFGAGTLFFQGYIYSEPAEGLLWRAPAAALAMTFFFFIWCYLDYRKPGSHNTIFDFTARDKEQYKKFWAVKSGKETLYEAHKNAKGLYDFKDAEGKIWRRSDINGITEAVILEDKDGQKMRFNADLTSDGKFNMEAGHPARYLEVDGRRRVMTDDYIGTIIIERWDLVLANLCMNGLHLAFWFAVLWLLLRFQWGHAFGLALVFWLITTLTIAPMLFNRAEKAANKNTAGTTTMLMYSPECA